MATSSGGETAGGPHLDGVVDPVRRAVLAQRLRAANVAGSPLLAELVARGQAEEVPIEVYAHGPKGELIGGVTGHTWAGWLHLDLLWVADDQQGRGLGAQLLTRAETMARDERGCRHARLETWTFQAPGFYEKQGYREAGRVDEHPPGAAELLFVKDL
jgi:GNAT superfamily N-acetyltransferase